MARKEEISQNQLFDLITSKELSWQSIIYDLIKTEQLDPWNMDIGVLADRYVQIISQLEDADFFISSKVLLACSLLLRLKSEILINSYISGLDEVLYGKKEEKRYALERISIDEGELPLLVPRTPMARHRKVTLQELMSALNKAIDTENRRIKREIKTRQTEKDVLRVLPKTTHVPLKVRIKTIFGIVESHIKENGNEHLPFTDLAPSREEKLASFVPVLHLANEGQLHMRQTVHFEDIHLSLSMHPEDQAATITELGLTEEEE